MIRCEPERALFESDSFKRGGCMLMACRGGVGIRAKEREKVYGKRYP